VLLRQISGLVAIGTVLFFRQTCLVLDPSHILTEPIMVPIEATDAGKPIEVDLKVLSQ